ncbi:MAG: protein translocase subunit SecF [Dehalococcoidia bacterium]|nr:protein translocase subunit SecF [Dehalococcoidia bacterium]
MDFIGKRRWIYLLSVLVILPGLISLAIPSSLGLGPPLRLGIDFAGGTSMTLAFSPPVAQKDLRQVLDDLGHGDASIQAAGEGRFFIRTRNLAPALAGQPSDRERIEQALKDRFGAAPAIEFQAVSALTAKKTVRSAAIAVFIASIGMLMYITWAFRRVPSPFRWGVVAIIALLHDVVVVIGSFSILGRLVGAEVNLMFLTALLAVIGYSVNDTVVVFDRIRENLQRGIARDLETVVNVSLSETLARSLNTGMPTLLAVLAVFLLGGATLRDFLLVFLIGITSGTYSSIAIASPLLVSWEKGELRWRWWPLRRRQPAKVA